MTAPRLQVVVAHPDDETFGCGSLLLHARANGARTAVCCATRGEAGEGPAGVSGAALAALREGELRSAATALGVDRVDVLDFADSGMSGDTGPGTLAGAPFDDVVAAVEAAVTAFAPDVLITLDAGDGHRDHARIRDAALAAARRAGVPRRYLTCLPRSLMRRWLDHARMIRPDAEHLDPEIAALGTPDEELTTFLDVAEHLPARERAIALHASQTSPYAGLPGDLYRAFLATAYLRRVHPPAEPGERETALFD